MSTVEAVDPRTGEVTDSHPAATVADVEVALDDALHVFRSGALRDDARRARALRAIAAHVRRAATEIVALATAETGLPEARLRGELERTAVQLELLADHVAAGEHHDAIIDLPDPGARPVPRPDLRRVRVPVGPVVVFGASNFPLAFSTAGGDTASALAAGCPVIVKGHPSHPGTGTLVAEAIEAGIAEAGLPSGAFAHVLAADLDVGEALVDHPATAAVAFTGSFRGGAALLARANARPNPIPVYAEMGSLNPVVVTARAFEGRGGEIVDALAGAVGTFGGQLCTKPGLVFVPEGTDLADRLANALAEKGPQVLLNRGVHSGLDEGLGRLAASAGVERVGTGSGGGTGAAGGEAGGGEARGFLARPAVFRAAARTVPATPALREEHFGPAVVVLEHRDEHELFGALQALDGQLACTVFAEPSDHAALQPLVDRFAEQAGRVIFDGVPTGVSVTLAMHHGGPWPASSHAAHTSVGATAVDRFLRAVVFQNVPDALLPPPLQDANPLGLVRRVNGERTTAPVTGM